ncbi:MAG: hypothetical protein NWE83_03010 [Candidatus Bathyarchaeota archaeon]|jgi:hypothetical protein|nr:hypothetical protein [Candidatus Bathyarchaeota archaeon]
MAENSVQVQDIRKDMWCWHCLKWIRWLPNPQHIQNMQDLLLRPGMERHIIMTTHGISPKEVGLNPPVALNLRVREAGVHQLNPWAKYPSLMNLLDGYIDWRAEQGSYVPYCSICHRSLLSQEKWISIKGWIKYPLLLIGIGVSLWLLTILLGREVLLWG